MERSIFYGQVVHLQFLNTFSHVRMTRFFIARMLSMDSHDPLTRTLVRPGI